MSCKVVIRKEAPLVLMSFDGRIAGVVPSWTVTCGVCTGQMVLSAWVIAVDFGLEHLRTHAP